MKILSLILYGMAALGGVARAADAIHADRQAILAMQGEYAVQFSFQETARLVEGYVAAPAYHSRAYETVVVLQDSPRHIVLQHLLVHDGHVTKHWRQEWVFEAPRRWEFVADRTWRWRDVPAALRAGGWTQCVYEVSDAPRYCGTGRWVHGDGISTWTSDVSWRPLPRREYSKREDYNVLMAVNRHTIVPGGWTHEQDNTKVVRDGNGQITALLVRETGFNDYQRTDEADGIDFSPAYDYWQRTADYWARVRAYWATRLADPMGVRLLSSIDGMALIEPLFKQAQTVVEGGQVSDADIEAVFDKWVRPDGTSADDK